MATLFGILEQEIFLQFQINYFSNLYNLSEIYKDDFEKVKAKLTKKLELEVSKTKDKVYKWIDSISPMEGVTLVESLKVQVEENNIESKDLLLLKYRDYLVINTTPSTKRNDFAIRDKFIP